MSYLIPIGTKFGSLTVLGQAPKRSTNSVKYCSCTCGKTVEVYTANLTNGNSTKCKDCHLISHNMSYSPEYRAWQAMKNRCDDPEHDSYSNYGGRGIKIDPRWYSFETFIIDMGLRPSSKHQLDRKDNARGYSKVNCRWVLPIININNRRNTRYLTLDNVTKPLGVWAKEYGLNHRTLWNRVFVLNWPIEQALKGK